MKTSNTSFVASGGTLVAWLLCREGLVIAADRAQWDAIRGERDVQKLRKVAPCVAFASTGNPVFDITLTNGRIIPGSNADVVIETFPGWDYFRDDPKFWQSLFNAIEADFYAMLERLPDRALWPSTGTLFQTAFFFVFESELRVRLLVFNFKNEPPSPGQLSAEPEALSPLGPDAIGTIEVTAEIRRGKDQRFDDVRAERLISRFFHSQHDHQTTSVDDAVALLKRLMAVTNQRTKLLEQSEHRISANADVAILRPKRLDWLERKG